MGVIDAAARQAAGDAPLEGCEVKRGTCGAHQAHDAHLFHRLHHHNGRGGVDQDFEAFEERRAWLGICSPVKYRNGTKPD